VEGKHVRWGSRLLVGKGQFWESLDAHSSLWGLPIHSYKFHSAATYSVRVQKVDRCFVPKTY